jgi:hypothetical protein
MTDIYATSTFRAKEYTKKETSIMQTANRARDLRKQDYIGTDGTLAANMSVLIGSFREPGKSQNIDLFLLITTLRTLSPISL